MAVDMWPDQVAWAYDNVVQRWAQHHRPKVLMAPCARRQCLTQPARTALGTTCVTCRLPIVQALFCHYEASSRARSRRVGESTCHDFRSSSGAPSVSDHFCAGTVAKPNEYDVYGQRAMAEVRSSHRVAGLWPYFAVRRLFTHHFCCDSAAPCP